MMATPDGHEIYWELRGNPDGKPAVVLHGGPGSGCAPWWADHFDLDRYRVLMFDQRGCGRSRPYTLEHNTTQHLIADIERLRALAGVDRWLVLGGSWGSCLALAYAQAHPERVSELVLFAVTAGTRSEIEHVTRGADRSVHEYYRLLTDPDPAIQAQAARDWCAWEDSLVGGHDPRYDDPVFRLNFARLVTHYWSHDCFLEDGRLLRGLDRLESIPGVLVHGLDDYTSPDTARTIARTWGKLELVEGAGHGGPAIRERVAAAIDRFADR